jgi:exocyst complex component 4
MFKFADTDLRAVTHDIKMADEVVHSTLRSTVPGLVPTSQADGAVFSGSVADEAVSVNKHRNIVPANPFNVTTLFQPTLAFINRASASAPPGFEDEAKAFGVVLEDFVVHTFLPQLDERVTKAFQQAVSGGSLKAKRTLTPSGHDLRQDGTQAGSTSSVRVMELIQTLCVMLHTTPFHRENYSRLVVGVIVQYYQQCSARFKGTSSGYNTS